MGIKELLGEWINRHSEFKDEFKEAQRQRKIQRLVEQREKSSNERELERYYEEERQRQINEQLSRFREQRKQEMWHENQFKADNFSILKNENQILRQPNIFSVKSNMLNGGGQFL